MTLNQRVRKKYASVCIVEVIQKKLRFFLIWCDFDQLDVNAKCDIVVYMVLYIYIYICTLKNKIL